jgi:hypothetical protein
MAVEGLGRRGTEDRRGGRGPYWEHRVIEGPKANQLIAIIASQLWLNLVFRDITIIAIITSFFCEKLLPFVTIFREMIVIINPSWHWFMANIIHSSLDTK